MLYLPGQLMNSVNIFIGHKRIVISSAKNKPHLKFPNANLLQCHYSEEKKIPELFRELIDSKNSDILLITGPVTKTLKILSRKFKTIEAAGGLIQNLKQEYLFIFRFGKWDLPKGKIDKYESVRSAAKRECREECGLKDLHILKKLKSTYHMYEQDKWILKKTHWFLMSSADNHKLVPQTEEGITKALWLKKSELKKVEKNTFPSILEVLHDAAILKQKTK